MTDEQIRDLLKPRHNWTAIVGTAIAVGGAVWAIVARLATTPTGEQFEKSNNRQWETQIKVDRIEGKVDRVSNDLGDLKGTVNEIRVTLQKGNRGR